MSYINKEAAIDLIESMIADKGVAFNPHKLAMALKDMESVEIPEAKDTDLISRQAAIESLMAHFIPQTYTGEQVEQAEKRAQKIMNEVPPVEPKQSVEDVQGCDGCRYNTLIPQKECLRCKRYWRDSYEHKESDRE